ncbi:DUF2207 domain-containing protein [candidate division KSB1 bacterium]|nr:DUF2207 domain-containing protein [candidate division KSB1 bacterium]
MICDGHRHFQILLLLFTLVGIHANGWSKQVKIDFVDIRSDVLPDGSLIIEETRSYRFDGTFHWADYERRLANLGEVTDIQLFDGPNEWRQDQKSKQQGTFQVYQDRRKFYLRWYFHAKNESRQFIIRYRIEDVVKVYDDVADLQYNFLDAYNKLSIDRIDVSLKLLFDADTSRVKAWLHAPLHGNLRFSNGMIHARVDSIPYRQNVELRVIFPPAWVRKPMTYDPVLKYEEIVEQERLRAINTLDKSNASLDAPWNDSESQAVQWNIITALMGMLSISVLYWLWGRGADVPYNEMITSTLPENISPALANYIYNFGQLNGGALVSTILDLARWSYLRIDDGSVGRARFPFSASDKISIKLNEQIFDEDHDQLAKYELSMVQFLYGELADETPQVTLRQVRKAGFKMMRWFHTWKKMVIEQWGKRPIFDRASVYAMIGAMCLSIIVIAIGLGSIITDGPAGLIGFIAGLLLAGASFFVLRLTPGVKLLRRKLAAYRRYLTRYHFQQMQFTKHTPVEDFLIYGIALGVPLKTIRLLLAHVPENQFRTHFPWYVDSIHAKSLEPAASMSHMVASVTININAAAGVGGAG